MRLLLLVENIAPQLRCFYTMVIIYTLMTYDSQLMLQVIQIMNTV